MLKPHSTTLLFAFFLLQYTIISTTKAECVEVSRPRTRIFQTLVAFQTNKFPFDNSASGGNYVAFAEKDIDTLHKNSFIAYDSGHIVKLFLDNHHIRSIQDGAFISLNCLMKLNLQKNQIESISRGIFADLKGLHELNLGENNIKEIPERIFFHNPRMRTLNLTRNRLTVLQPESFFNLSQLIQLDLSYNSLYSLRPETFAYFHNLLNLQLGMNHLQSLHMEKYANLSTLNVLNLSSNALESFDSSNQFSFGSTLTELYLGDNFLTQLNSLGVKNNLRALKLIDINDNPWSCTELHGILTAFNASRIVYKGSTEKGPNIVGIACNRSLEEYKRNKKWIAPVATSPLPSTTKQTSTNEGSSQDLNNAYIEQTLGQLFTLTVSLFVMCVIYFIIDIAVKCGCLEMVRRWRTTSPVLDNDIENFSLFRQGS